MQGDPKRKLRMSLKPGGGSAASVGGGSGVCPTQTDGDETDTTQTAQRESDARARQLGYNPSRIPSWCDRVLWRSYPECPCEVHNYRSDPSGASPLLAEI